jgi:cytochrome b6-f complex iron-sulfur subunit
MPKQPYIPRMTHDDADRVKGIDPASRKAGAAAGAPAAAGAVKAAVKDAKQPGTVRPKPEAKANLIPYRSTVAPARSFERRFTPAEVSRRRFVQTGTYGGIALISAAVAAFFFPGGWQIGRTRNGPYFSIGSKNVLFEPPTRFKIGAVDAYQVGTTDVRWQTRYRIWVVREPNKLYVGLLVCTHLGCTPDWKEAENKFKCPCHGSGYYQDGVNFEGPAPRPMEHCDVTIDPADGQIIVDKGKTYRKDKGEWVNGGSQGGAFIAL